MSAPEDCVYCGKSAGDHLMLRAFVDGYERVVGNFRCHNDITSAQYKPRTGWWPLPETAATPERAAWQWSLL